MSEIVVSQPGFWRRVGAAIRNLVRPDDPWRYQQWVSFDQPSGINITPDTALELSAVWGCVNIIANSLAASPWHIVTTSYSAKGELRKETLPNDPVYYLLNTRPNPDMTGIAFREAMLWMALTWGNGYAEIGKSLSGKVSSLYPLLPHRTFPRRDREPPYTQYYEYWEMDGGRVRLEADQVFHLKGPGITGLLGENLTARAAKSMGLAAAMDRFASTYFGNGTQIGGVLEYPKKFPRDPQGRPDGTIDRLRNEWAQLHQGPNKAWRPAILEDGLTWKPFESKASDAQLVDARKFQLEEIARWYGVPAHMIGHAAASQGYGKNLEELGLGFVRHTLRPWATRLEQEADYKLFGARTNKSTHLDFRHLTRGDAKTQAEANEIRRRNGVLSINEWREEDGLNHIGAEGDVRVVQTTYQTLEKLAAPPAPVPTPGQGAPGEQEPGPTGPETDRSTEDGDTTTDEPSNTGRPDIAAEAMILLLETPLERYSGRLAARQADLQRGGAGPAKVQNHLAEERVRLRPWVLELADEAMKLAGVTREEMLGAVDAVDNGSSPTAAVERFVDRLLKETR